MTTVLAPVRAFADGVAVYAEAGWPCFPVDPTTKALRLTGITGASGVDATIEQLVTWAGPHAGDSIAVRMPEGVIGIDVDHYTKGGIDKNGAEQLTHLEQQLGPLPATWSSTARGSVEGPGPSRIMFFRVPVARYVGGLGNAIEVVQRHHRYAIVAPSVHAGVGAPYRWYSPAGEPVDAPPRPDQLAELPVAWVEHLAEGASSSTPEAAEPAAGFELISLLTADHREPCAFVAGAVDEAAEELGRAAAGARHDTATRAVYNLVLAVAVNRHTGAAASLERLRSCWADVTAGEGREAEFADMVTTAARKAVTAAGGVTALAGTCPTCRTGDGAAPLAPEPLLVDAQVAIATGQFQRPPAARYFQTTGGLQAETLARDVLWFGPARVGRDDIMWAYSGGVWKPAKHLVRDRTVALLGERWRGGHASAAEAIVRALSDSIDCDPISDVINFGNGLLDWRSGELRPHDPEVLTTVQLGVDWRPEAACPTFDRYLADVVPADVVPVVWELIAYLMYSGNPLHKAVMLTGTGRNGKGTFLRVVTSLLGRHNVTNVSLVDLVNTRFSTASLFGKLANIAGDIDATYMENTATFKAITGGDTISAEHKGRDRFDFTPWAVPVFSANKIPASADTSVGYLSRWLVVPFPHDFTGREDRFLDARLATELEGIAAKALGHLPDLLARGDFERTTSGEAAREDFERRVDQVRTWLADCCSIGDEHPFLARTTLYEAYKRWAARDGHKPVRASEFYDRLESAGGVPKIIRGTRGYVRIRVDDTGWGQVDLHPAPQIPTEPAPSPAPSKTTEFSSESGDDGAEGAAIAQPPTRARARTRKETTSAGAGTGAGAQGGYDHLHPLHPPAPSTPTTAAAARRKAETEAKRQAAIAAAAGDHVGLPATVTADGTVARCTPAEAAALLAGMTEVTVDVEHTGFPVGHELYALRTVQLGCSAFAVVLDPADLDQADVVRDVLAAAEILHAHSATADLVPLAHAGLVDEAAAWAKMHDTVIPAKLADPASTGSDPSLKKLAQAVLGEAAVSPTADEARKALFKAGKWLTETKADTPLERSGWAQVDPGSSTMIRYAASDVIDDAALAARLPALDPALLDRERLAQRMTARVASRGLLIDGDHVAQLHAEQTAALDDAARRLGEFGIENPGSDVQVGAAIEAQGLMLPRTPTGKPSVAKAGLEQHARLDGPLGDLIRARLDYQTAENRLGLFLEPYRQLVEHGDGRARPTVYTLQADTGRMSCVRPNLQQVPREGGFRACLMADPGHVLVSADFAGVELRVAGALSGDQNLLAILADPSRDLHREVAQIAFGPDAGKAERYMAKRGVFGRIYGGGVGAIARGVGVDEITARSIIDALDALLPGLTEWSRMVRTAVENGSTQFPTYAGRVVHLPRDYPHKGPNYCIQGTARELLIDALVRWQDTRWGDAVLLPVHDELVVQVPEDDAEAATAVLVEAMTGQITGVQIVAEPSEPSRSWKDSV